MKKVTIKFLVIRLHKVYFGIYPVEYPKKMAMINAVDTARLCQASPTMPCGGCHRLDRTVGGIEVLQ